jgi:type II secretory pathway pseudopilin PulG
MKSIRSGESGYVLLAVMLAVTLILVAMSIELPRIAQQIKREKEEELVHRGKDYATAVKRFVHKNGGRYPLSVEQLEDTNHIRFLRKRYKDPMTGESDWKMVHVGEAQVNIPAAKPGAPGGANPGLFGSGGTNPPSTTSPSGITNPPTGTAQLNNPGGSTFGQPQPQPGGTGQLGSLNTSNIGNGQTVGGGQIIGVASTSKKQSIKEFNDKDHYDEWYFVYDLRLEQSGSTGVTVAEPRVGGSTAGGSSSTTGVNNSTSGGGSTTGTSGTQPPPAGTNSGQPQPTGTPQPPPQVPN